MSEYWVSKKQYWCQYCKIFIRDDAPSRRQHETGLRHQGNKERFLRDIYKTGERSVREKAEEKKMMAQIEQNAANSSASISAAPTTGSASPSSSAAPAKGKLAAGQPVNTDKYANYSTAASLGYVDADAILAERAKLEREERAKVGQAGTWETVAVITPQNIDEEEVGEEDPRYAFHAAAEDNKHQLSGLLRGSLDADPSEEARNFRFEMDRQPGESSDRPCRIKPDVYDDGGWDPDSILKLGKKAKRETSASRNVGLDAKVQVKEETSIEQQTSAQDGETSKATTSSDALPRDGDEANGQALADGARSPAVKEADIEAKPTTGGASWPTTITRSRHFTLQHIECVHQAGPTGMMAPQLPENVGGEESRPEVAAQDPQRPEGEQPSDQVEGPSVTPDTAKSTEPQEEDSTYAETGEEREQADRENEDQRTEGSPCELDQENEDTQLVQEELVSEFQEGKKRVKVYELRGQAWEDRGTGFVEGIYDEASDEALLVVTREDTANGPEQADPTVAGENEPEPGGFFREGEDPYLLRTRVGKADPYSRQQETLIVWTEPTGMDVALSFQDPEGCNNIWDFIQEVQRHLQLIYGETALQMWNEVSTGKLTETFFESASPQLGPEQVNPVHTEREGRAWEPLTLSNLREQETSLKLSSRSIAGREKTVEFVISNDYVRQMIQVFQTAEDVESLEDLHSLCTMMSTILSLNDNGLYEYLLQEDVFLGMAGIMEYDPEYPTYKATYREFLSEGSRFKEVVPIEDETIRAKIHQTYRLLYLKDVILARVLDDPMFNILNSLLFFNQIDIITHIATNDAFLHELFAGFKDHKTKSKAIVDKLAGTAPAPTEQLGEDEIKRRKDIVALLHQLMLMGKQVQMQHRQQLYRTLVERGLLFVCEWALQQQDPVILNQIAEMLGIVIDHDVNAVRSHALREHAEKRRTIAEDMSSLLLSSNDLGLKSQMADAIRTLVDIGGEGSEVPAMLRTQRDQATGDAFLGYFYEACIIDMYRPMLELPDFKQYKTKPVTLAAPEIMLMQYLSELLAFFVAQHGHRAQFFILSNPVSAGSHFIHRHLIKYELMLPMLELLESESPRDNMLSSACLDIFEIIRRDNLKPVINYLFEKYKPRLQALGKRPLLKTYLLALALRWEQNNEPMPVEQTSQSDENGSFNKTMDTTEDDYFNGESDEDEIGPMPPSVVVSTSPAGGQKRKRFGEGDQADTTPPTKITRLGTRARSFSGGILGLDYDDGSDSDSSETSPQTTTGLDKGLRPSAPIRNESTNVLASSAMEDKHSAGNDPSSSPGNKLRLKLNASPGPIPQDLDDVASRMAKKRRQEIEQDDDGLAILLNNNKSTTSKPSKGDQQKPTGNKEKAPSGVAGLGLAMKDAGKKLKINLGFGKKNSSEGDKKKSELDPPSARRN
ncbi:hypothetical protein QFC22_000875 [Naganishia vaughanmartiniae]|uniref:Uncharacterized protein n=1 Tax=Naganishia vaughanmartiniae TaxID=1424756 RepID=A0ACC2XL17_9TREE|nr:hypothetical protein QFC22_000875 [Naganishia vaughanmartiniae]